MKYVLCVFLLVAALFTSQATAQTACERAKHVCPYEMSLQNYNAYTKRANEFLRASRQNRAYLSSYHHMKGAANRILASLARCMCVNGCRRVCR